MFSLFRKIRAPYQIRFKYTTDAATTDADTKSSNIGGANSFVEPPPRIFALIIGINNYKTSPHIPNLKGATSDAENMRDYLQKHLGVPSSQIRNLRNSEATRAAIIDGIKAFSFDNRIKKGDPILIYYAGHGGSVDTPEGWEVGSTGKTELLIPYDCSSPLEDGNPVHGIPDRTLGALLSQLAMKKGDNITVILDCCHSGSGTRNLDPTFKARVVDVGNIPSDLDRDVWIDSELLEGSRGTKVHSGFARKGLRSHVLLAACHSQEVAYERTSRGMFTAALLKTLVDIGIDKLTYATLIDWMPPLSSGQNPQCVGVFRERSIFNGKGSSKRTAGVYKIRKSEGGTYVIDAGEAAGISVGAEFEVYQDQNFASGDSLGTVVARELSAFSTTLYAKESKIALERDGVAFKSRAVTEERVRIHVADESLKDLVKKMDPNQRTIELVKRDHGAEFGMALENRKVVFNIYDSDVTKYGLTRMPYILEATLEAISPVIRAAAHFYWHRRRTLQTNRGILAEKVKLELTELKLLRVEYDDELKPVGVYYPTANGSKGGKVFHVQTGKPYGWKIINNCKMPLYPALFYFDNSDWSITPYYVPPIVGGIVEPPLKGEGYLTVGYGDSGWVPHTFFLREGQSVDVGILKLFLSRKQVDLSHIAQPSPFKVASSPDSCHRVTKAGAVLPEPMNLPLPWDTIEIPVVQRHAAETP